jgi:hypothetical protein
VQSQEHHIKEIVHKNSSWQAKQSILCGVLQRMRKNVRKLRLELWRQKNWLLHHDNAPPHTSFLIREFLTKNNMTVVPHPLYFPLFPRLKIKLKGRYFVTIVVESQASLFS